MENSSFFAAQSLSLSKVHGPVPFDVYVRLGQSKFTKVFGRNHPLDRERFDGYVLKGTNFFYIPEGERKLFLNSGRLVLDSLRREQLLGREDSCQILDEIAAHSLVDLYQTKAFDDKDAQITTAIVEGYIEIIAHEKVALAHVIRLARRKPDFVKHATLTAIFSALIARAIEPDNKNLQLSCGLGGFLHDIGFSLLSPNLDEHTVKNSSGANTEVRKHPQYGAQILSASTRLPADVRRIVGEHHEGFDGTGYPHGWRGDHIHLGARIVGLAEAFVALTTGGKGADGAFPAYLAVHTLAQDRKFDPNVFAAFARLLKL